MGKKIQNEMGNEFIFTGNNLLVDLSRRLIKRMSGDRIWMRRVVNLLTKTPCLEGQGT